MKSLQNVTVSRSDLTTTGQLQSSIVFVEDGIVPTHGCTFGVGWAREHFVISFNGVTFLNRIVTCYLVDALTFDVLQAEDLDEMVEYIFC